MMMANSVLIQYLETYVSSISIIAWSRHFRIAFNSFVHDIPKWTLPAFELEESKCVFRGEWLIKGTLSTT